MGAFAIQRIREKIRQGGIALDRSNSETAGKRCEYGHAGVHGSPGSASRGARVDRDPNLPQALGNTAHRGTSI
ncbi:hypothetical protein T12_5778, partial [Trichinella patagoniensis]